MPHPLITDPNHLNRPEIFTTLQSICKLFSASTPLHLLLSFRASDQVMSSPPFQCFPSFPSFYTLLGQPHLKLYESISLCLNISRRWGRIGFGYGCLVVCLGKEQRVCFGKFFFKKKKFCRGINYDFGEKSYVNQLKIRI